MLAGPDCVRMIEEFERVNKLPLESSGHREVAHSLQCKFLNDVQSFTKVVNGMGNPFLTTGHELITLDTRAVVDDAVALSLSKIHEVGQAFHKEYVNTRLDKVTVPMSDTIKRNNMFTFANRLDPRKKESKVGILKHNTMLITQLFLSLQSRPDADMLEFFKFENQREPPALSDRSSLRAGTKSDILKCIHAPTGHAIPATQAIVQVVDMATIIHMVPPTRALTFKEYVPMHTGPFLKAQMTTTVQRINIVWDTYPEQNLKSQTQLRRGLGTRTQLEPDGDGSTPIPKRYWQSYIVFSFVSKQMAKTYMDGILVISTESVNVLSNKPFDVSALQPCNHAEADTRIILHLAHASSQGHDKAFVRTVDSDIVVLAIAFYEQLGLSELRIGFGSWKNYRDIPVHSIYAQLVPSKSLALALFHALTGCDTTYQLLGCGKKTAWTAWNSIPVLTDIMITLTEAPESFTIEFVHMQCIERFVVLMYSKTCSSATVNDARHHLFSNGSRSINSIPATQAALFEHVKMSLLQASFIWKQLITCHQEIPQKSL